MVVRGIIAVVTIAAMVVLLLGMVADQSRDNGAVEADATSLSQDAPTIEQVSAPLQQYRFPEYGFSIEAPEDWRVLNADEQRALAEMSGDVIGASDTIVALIPDIPNGFKTAVVMIDTMQEPMEGESLSTLNTMSSMLTGLDWVKPGSWTGKNWTRVTTQPFEREIGGYAAATMGLHTKHDGEGLQEANVRMTMIELPKEAVLMSGIMTNDAFRNSEVEAILTSFKVTLND